MRATHLGAAMVLAATLPQAVLARADTAVRLEIGSEYDTNIQRVSQDEPASAGPLGRFGVRYRGSYRTGGGSAALSAYAGTKLFATAPGQSENAFIMAAQGGYAHKLPGRPLTLGLQASYYDAINFQAFECAPDCGEFTEGRFFSTAAADAVVGIIGPGTHRLNVFAGARRFEYKPEERFDWSGDSYGFSYRTAIWRGDDDDAAIEDLSSVDFSAGYRLSRRNYRGDAFGGVFGESFQRVDLHHAATVETTYTGERLYAARYQVQVNDSNSLGQSLVRQRLELQLTTELVADVFLTATAAVQLNVFLDALLLDPDVNAQTILSIDDENRNSLSLHLARRIHGKFSVEGRYSIFSNEFATEELRFRRQTAYLGLVCDYD